MTISNKLKSECERIRSYGDCAVYGTYSDHDQRACALNFLYLSYGTGCAESACFVVSEVHHYLLSLCNVPMVTPNIILISPLKSGFKKLCSLWHEEGHYIQRISGLFTNDDFRYRYTQGSWGQELEYQAEKYCLSKCMEYGKVSLLRHVLKNRHSVYAKAKRGPYAKVIDRLMKNQWYRELRLSILGEPGFSLPDHNGS